MDRWEFPHLTDPQFELVRKMVGIFGGEVLRSLAAATPAEQGLQAPMADVKPAQPKPLWLKGENLHIWVREVEFAMDAGLISTERLRVAFALPNLGGWAKAWAYTREATTPGCFTTWAQLCRQLRSAFLPANYEYRRRSRFLACKQGKRELHEYIQDMRVLAASLVGNPLPEHIRARTPQARTAMLVWQGHNASTGAVQGAPAAGASIGPVPMELGTAVQSSIRCYGCGKLGYMHRACPAGGQRRLEGPVAEATTQEPGELGSPCGRWTPWRHLAPESLGALETRKSSGGQFVAHASNPDWYGDPFRVLIDSGASTNFARRQTVARNGDKFADALRESEGRGQVSVRLADGTVVNVPGVRMDLAVKFEDFDSMESFLVLDMDNRPAVSDRALVSIVPTSVLNRGARDGRQGAYAPEEVLGVTDSSEDVAMSLATGRETKAHCQACTIATTASPNAKSRRAVWASTVAVPGGTDQVGNIRPQAGNVVPQTAEAIEEDAESTSGGGNIAPHRFKETEKNESAANVSSVGSEVPRGVKKTNTRAEVPLSTSRLDNQVLHSGSETPPTLPADAGHHEALPEVSALLNLKKLSMKDFLDELKAGEIAEMGFTKQRATRLGSEILKNPENPVYPLLNVFLDVVMKTPPSKLPPDRGVRHEIDLVLDTKYCVTRQRPLPREQCEAIDAFFTEKVKAGVVRESKSPHSTPTFCVRKPNGKWRLVHGYNKLNNATVPAQTPILRKDVLLNNISGCTLYGALDPVDGYYQILMRESDIPLTAVSTPSGMLWEWLVMPQGLSNAPATFNRLVTQVFRPFRTFAQTYFDDIFVHS
ncbi:LOW QUALITY PROTEIN: Pol protein, partial [Phytophthora palmivora]